jgi:PA14 domain
MLRVSFDNVRAAAATAILALALLAGTNGAAAEHVVNPASPQPKAGALKPGLAVNYHFTYVRSIHQLLRYAEPRKGDVGKPLPQLNYHTGFNNVLTSDRNVGVGAKIHGYIKFDKPGVYQLKVNSNDGVRLMLGGKQIFEDPEVHSDEMSDPIPVKIDQPGWYPLLIWYFQRKGTATLQLFWQAPGSSESVLVPPSAFAHVPAS